MTFLPFNHRVSLTMIVKLATLLSVSAFAAGQYRAISPEPAIEVVEGDSIHLPCRLDPQVNLSAMTVDWKKSNKVVYARRRGHDLPRLPQYNNRATIKGLETGDLTLLISSAQLNDTGSFKGTVHSLNAGCTINVTVVKRDQQNRTQTGDSSTNGPLVEEVTHLDNPDAAKKDPINPTDVGVGVAVAVVVVVVAGGVILLLVKRGKIQVCQRGQQEETTQNESEMEKLRTQTPEEDEDPHRAAYNGLRR